MGEQNNLTTLAKRLRPLIKLAAQEVIGATPLISRSLLTFSGNLSVSDSPLRIYNQFGVNQIITKVSIAVNTAPSGAAIIIDIHKGGTTIFTNQAHRPQIEIGAFIGSTTDIDVSGWADGEYLTVHIDQIGSGTGGADLVVQFVSQGNTAAVS